MSGWSPLARVAVAVLVTALVGGCAQQIPGLGKYSSGRTAVPPADVDIRGSNNSEVDRHAGDAIFDIETFWAEQMPEVFGRRYEKVKGFYSIDPNGRVAAPCTDEASDIRGNAFYCPSQDIVAWDRRGLFPQLQERFGRFLIAMVLAHEWGHAIQKRTKLPSSRTIVVETQADCYAGAWTRYALLGNAPHFEIERSELDSALAGYLLFRDPLGATQDDKQAHGSGFDRISAFQDGYDKGAKFCAAFDDDRTFTQIEFVSNEDLARQGNLPFEDALRDGPEDIADYWAQAYQRTYSRPWQALAGVETYADSNRPRCDGNEVDAVEYCPTDDKVYGSSGSLREVYHETGDFGPMSLIAVAYGQAVRRRLGQQVSGDGALLGSICLAGAYAGDVFAERRTGAIRLSPGDLDEAIRALLDFAGRTGFFEARGTTGFDRASAFRRGFNDIKSCPG